MTSLLSDTGDVAVRPSCERGEPGRLGLDELLLHSPFNKERQINMGDFVMQVGRPVLLVTAATKSVPDGAVRDRLEDTREARRAVTDVTQAFARSLGATWAGGSGEMPPPLARGTATPPTT